jgi:hypothetical protein
MVDGVIGRNALGALVKCPIEGLYWTKNNGSGVGRSKKRGMLKYPTKTYSQIIDIPIKKIHNLVS